MQMLSLNSIIENSCSDRIANANAQCERALRTHRSDVAFTIAVCERALSLAGHIPVLHCFQSVCPSLQRKNSPSEFLQAWTQHDQPHST